VCERVFYLQNSKPNEKEEQNAIARMQKTINNLSAQIVPMHNQSQAKTLALEKENGDLTEKVKRMEMERFRKPSIINSSEESVRCRLTWSMKFSSSPS
jgi:hypothetical protein